MTAVQVLAELLRNDARVWFEGDELCYRAPKGVVAGELRAELARCKAELRALLGDRRQYCRASFAQQRLWFLEQWAPGTCLYVIPTLALELSGLLDAGVLRDAINEIVRRHDALRTTFDAIEGQPVQVVAPTLTLELKTTDISSTAHDNSEAAVAQWLGQEAQRPFDLARGPLVRACLLRLSPEEHVLFVPMHHSVSDGWSVAVFLKELIALYEAFAQGQASPLSALPMQYPEYTQWQRQLFQGEALAKQTAFWRRTLDGCPPFLDLPTDRPRPLKQAYRGAKKTLTISATRTEQLRALSRGAGASLFMTLLTAFMTVLHRYAGQDDLVLGTGVANRARPELNGLIGFFVNTLPLRADFSGNPTFREALARVRNVALDAFEHQDLPLEKLVEEVQPVRSTSHSPFFQVVCVLHNVPKPRERFSGLTVRRLDMDTGVAKFDLTLAMEEASGGINGALEFNTDLFDADTAARMTTHFQRVLDAVAENAELRLWEIPLLSEGERRQALFEWNADAAPYPSGKGLAQLFDEQAGRTPDAVAVECGDQALTYAELRDRAGRLASTLKRLGIGPDRLVAICLDRSIELIVGLLGIIKAGGAYVPLDPLYPEERRTWMLADSGARVLVTDALGAGHEGVTVVRMDEMDRMDQMDTGHGAATGADLAYVMYTSGSTGRPKGVMIPQRAVSRLVLNTNYIALGPTDVIAQASNVSFDAATFEIWGALLNGARIAVIRKEELLSVRHLAEQLRARRVSALFVTTALFNQVAREAPDGFAGLRYLLFGGEAVDPKAVAAVIQAGPPEHLLHVYGPTETTTFATWWEVASIAPDAATIPIGLPIANTEVYVLDRLRQPVPVGVVGEVYIGGPGLARGYLNSPELTEEKFVAHPFAADPAARLYRSGDLARRRPNGAIEFVGRVDQQIKLRGFRIELGELEAALAEHSDIQECVAALREDEPGDKRLVAYYLASSGESIPASELRRFLTSRLPEHMIPSAFVGLPALPLTPNGKVNRQALPAPERIRPDLEASFTAPRTDTEQGVAAVWSELLGVDRIGIDDDFFALGGHSLLAIQLMSRLNSAFDVDLPLPAFFESPTVAGLAHQVDCRRSGLTIEEEGGPLKPSAVSALIVPIKPRGAKPPLFCIAPAGGVAFPYYALAHALDADQPVYGLQDPSFGADSRLCDSIEAMAAAYVEAVRTVQPSGPYALAGWSFGGIVAFEMAQQFTRQGERVALVGLIEARLLGEARTVLRLLSRGFVSHFWANAKVVWSVACSGLQNMRDALFLNVSAGKARSGARGSLLHRLRWVWLDTVWRFMLRQAGMADVVAQNEHLLSIEQPSSMRFMVIAKANMQAAVRYRPRPYPGRLDLFHASERPQGPHENAATEQWAALADEGVEVHTVPGDHFLIIRNPNVARLAEEIAACLERTGE